MSPVALAAQAVNPGDTAWMLVATALVLMMTPALGLFYCGLVRGKNTLNTFMMSIGALGRAATHGGRLTRERFWWQFQDWESAHTP